MFAFELALKLGCTLSELTQRMSCAEFNYWMAYDNIASGRYKLKDEIQKEPISLDDEKSQMKNYLSEY